MTTQWLLSLLLLISFCSSLFRLAFNKRFFDIARAGDGPNYLLLKSHASQTWLAAIFGILAILFTFVPGTPEQQLDSLYLIAGALALGYLRYRSARQTPVQ